MLEHTYYWRVVLGDFPMLFEQRVHFFQIGLAIIYKV